MFCPTEIIFSATDACNLHCAHCFVSRTPSKLYTEDAIAFLETVKDYKKQNDISSQKTSSCHIERIGFSGGEPFLYTDFLCRIIRWSVDNDFMFDQIMTNGAWWKDETELYQKLQLIYDAGYDGHIGLSYDIFHGQSLETITTFIKAAENFFGEGCVNIQTVKPFDKKLMTEKILSEECLKKNFSVKKIKKQFPSCTVYELPQTFTCEEKKAWKSWKWFTDDYCEGPGNILYIHSSGNIAPCCGFANENKQLFIGTIKDSFAQVIENARNNKMIEICFETGLAALRKELQKKGTVLPGKTSDICTFCDYICKTQNINIL